MMWTRSGLLMLALVAATAQPSFAGKKGKKAAAAAAKKKKKGKGKGKAGKSKAGTTPAAPKGYNPSTLIELLGTPGAVDDREVLEGYARSAEPDHAVWVAASDFETAEAELEKVVHKDISTIEYVRVRKVAGVSLWVEHGHWVPGDERAFAHYAFDDMSRLRFYREYRVTHGHACGETAAFVTIRYRPDGQASRSFRHTLNGTQDFTAAQLDAGCQDERVKFRQQKDPGFKPAFTTYDELPDALKAE